MGGEMTLEKSIKFYERNLERKRLAEARDTYKLALEFHRELLQTREQMDRHYLNLLISEYLEQGGVIFRKDDK